MSLFCFITTRKRDLTYHVHLIIETCFFGSPDMQVVNPVCSTRWYCQYQDTPTNEKFIPDSCGLPAVWHIHLTGHGFIITCSQGIVVTGGRCITPPWFKFNCWLEWKWEIYNVQLCRLCKCAIIMIFYSFYSTLKSILFKFQQATFPATIYRCRVISWGFVGHLNTIVWYAEIYKKSSFKYSEVACHPLIVDSQSLQSIANSAYSLMIVPLSSELTGLALERLINATLTVLSVYINHCRALCWCKW